MILLLDEEKKMYILQFITIIILVQQSLYGDEVVSSSMQGISYEQFLYRVIPAILVLLLLIYKYLERMYSQKLKNELLKNKEELRKKDMLLQQKLRMAAMGEMLSMIAHQWRQPLGAISSAIMGIDVKLARGKFDFSNKEGVEEFLTYLKSKHNSINDYVQYLSDTTDDFRNFFNPKRDREALSITKPIENALHILQTSLENKNIEVIKDFQTTKEFPLYQNEIMQVIINILRNSEENFTHREISNPKITIKTYEEDSCIAIALCDNGGGIEDAIMKNIFDPYFSTKDEKNASGLGLYMSKVMVEEHHSGVLSVVNYGNGVCFDLKFKMRDKDE